MRETPSARLASATTSWRVGPSCLAMTRTPSTIGAELILCWQRVTGQDRLVVAQLIDRLFDVVERPVRRRFRWSLGVRIPMPHQQLERADVDDAVVHEAVELGHVTREELFVLPDRIAAERSGLRVTESSQEAQRLPLGLRHAHAGSLHAIQEPARLVRSSIPGVHRSQLCRTLTNGQLGTARDDVEVPVGDDGRDFEQDVSSRIETGHFAVSPDEQILAPDNSSGAWRRRTHSVSSWFLIFSPPHVGPPFARVP